MNNLAEKKTRMQQLQKSSGSSFAQEASRDDLVVAYLMHRISNLSKEALADLAELAPQIVNCEDRTTYDEIAETMREIICPELIGDPQKGIAGDADGATIEKWMEWVGSKIKEKRKSAELTQVELAQKSNLPQSHISRLESGQHSPSHKTLVRIANALDIPVSELDTVN